MHLGSVDMKGPEKSRNILHLSSLWPNSSPVPWEQWDQDSLYPQSPEHHIQKTLDKRTFSKIISCLFLEVHGFICPLCITPTVVLYSLHIPPCLCVKGSCFMECSFFFWRFSWSPDKLKRYICFPLLNLSFVILILVLYLLRVGALDSVQGPHLALCSGNHITASFQTIVVTAAASWTIILFLLFL